jgi:hypothetical protein
MGNRDLDHAELVQFFDTLAPTVTGFNCARERVKTLRAAYMSALKDPELKVEAEKRGYELEPIGGDELESLAREVMAQPPAVIERMKKVLGN